MSICGERLTVFEIRLLARRHNLFSISVVTPKMTRP
jgi:hypothetical protein